MSVADVKNSIGKLDGDDISTIMAILDIKNRTGTKAYKIDTLAEFLEKPSVQHGGDGSKPKKSVSAKTTSGKRKRENKDDDDEPEDEVARLEKALKLAKQKVAAEAKSGKSSSKKTTKTEPKKTRKSKKPKKEGPKRPMSAYFLWMNDSRDGIKKKHPDASIGELGKIMGKEWGKVSEDVKKKFEKQAEKLKEQYIEVRVYRSVVMLSFF